MMTAQNRFSKNPKKKFIFISLIILIIFVLAAVSAGYYICALSQIKISDFSVNGFSPNKDGFILSGAIKVSNPNFISIDIKGIDYEVILVSTNQTLTKNHIDRQRLLARNITSIPFAADILWKPTADLAYSLVTSNETFILVKGRVFVADWPTNISLPFEQKFDIKPYVDSFVKKKVDETIVSISDSLGLNSTQVKQAVSDVAQEIKSFFN